MSDLPFHQQQLEFMFNLVNHRISFLDPLFRFLNYFDSPYFFFVLIPLLWIGFSYQWGIRIYYWFTFSNIINSIVKNLIGWPRPSTDLPELGFFHPSSHGFPSGGAQNALFLAGILIYTWKTPKAWILGLSYFLLISFSRLYIGVHYPIDVLGGWIIGALLLLLYILTKRPLELWLKHQTLQFLLILSLAIPISIMILVQNEWAYYLMSAAIGIGIGIFFSLRHRLYLRPPKDVSEGLVRSFIGIATLFLIVFLWPSRDNSPDKAFTAGVFMSLVVSPLCKLFLRPKSQM